VEDARRFVDRVPMSRPARDPRLIIQPMMWGKDPDSRARQCRG
jgi:hypothetical protein